MALAFDTLSHGLHILQRPHMWPGKWCLADGSDCYLLGIRHGVYCACAGEAHVEEVFPPTLADEMATDQGYGLPLIANSLQPTCSHSFGRAVYGVACVFTVYVYMYGKFPPKYTTLTLLQKAGHLARSRVCSPGPVAMRVITLRPLYTHAWQHIGHGCLSMPSIP